MDNTHVSWLFAIWLAGYWIWVLEHRAIYRKAKILAGRNWSSQGLVESLPAYLVCRFELLGA